MIVEKPYKDEDIICPCMGLTYANIKETVRDGASSVEEVLEITGAASVCGDCLGLAVSAARDVLEQ